MNRDRTEIGHLWNQQIAHRLDRLRACSIDNFQLH